MTWRRRTNPNPQLHSKAVWRPTQRSVVTPPVSAAHSPAPDISATSSSSTSALSQQTADTQTAMPPLSALEQVGRDVRVLILQCLDGRHKLTVVCRLSRTFRELSALAFRHDCIAALLQGAAVVHRAVRTTTGQLSWLCLWVTQAEKPGRSTLFTCPRSLRSLPHMSALKTLHITVQLRDMPGATASLRCIVRSVLSLPSLTALDITWCLGDRRDDPVPQLDWTDDALPTPVSLRHLTLQRLSLSAASFRQMCCLPLESLEVSSCTFQAGDDTKPVKAAQPSAWTMKQLKLCGPLRRELISAIGSYAQQLQQLMLRSCGVGSSGPAWDFSPLMTESGAPRLPHLTVLSLPTTWDVTRSESWLPELEQACTTASQQLVAAYSAQLTWLDVPVLNAASVSSWLRLLFCRCDHLDDLCVMSWTMDWRHPVELHFEPAEPGEVLTLPRLRTLTLANLPLTDGGLLSLLRRCPELEKCKLGNLRHATQAGKKAALRCCPKLE